jgi:hypothetical protein
MITGVQCFTYVPKFNSVWHGYTGEFNLNSTITCVVHIHVVHVH